MKIGNNRGGTLVFTLIVFMVLMIFGTFIMSFMVSENKMAISHKKNTQAYYLARSGAVAVESAIESLTDEETVELEKKLDQAEKDGENGVVVNVDWLGELDGITVRVKKDKGENLIIESTGEVEGTQEVVIKVMSKEKISGGPTINLDMPIIALESLSDSLIYNNFDKKNKSIYTPPIAKKADDPEKYKDPVFPKDIDWNGNTKYLKYPSGNIIGVDGEETNYIFNGDLSIVDTLTVKGKVNIFINGSLNVNLSNKGGINLEGEPENLNFYIPDKGSNNISIFVHHSVINANIATSLNGEIVLTSQESSGNSYNGTIYAPRANVVIGRDKSAIVFKGGIIGKNVSLIGLNANKADEFKDDIKEANKNMENSIIQLPEAEENKKTVYKKGYFK